MNEALPDLVARFTVRHSLFRKERVEAALFELDSYGCVIKTDKMFKPGDTVLLDLIMDMPFDKIRAENVPGLVTERRKHCSNFFYSIDFADLKAGTDTTLEEKLRRIREVLSKKQSLKSRRSSGSMPNMRHMA
ncbi:hypothetical protein [Marinobacter salexigens]|jgi:hypothetical protein|uniref:PilZ domain-containing protein n=1 Tax=Marinobacter salexigens TaxID=1925763 RepID=A0ABS6ACU3_9GAMM|nr:hypothetical protein [Marinobacter salexigens]MBU2875063.1 hypothetical protein [Marinobacter salexigens]